MKGVACYTIGSYLFGQERVLTIYLVQNIMIKARDRSFRHGNHSFLRPKTINHRDHSIWQLQDLASSIASHRENSESKEFRAMSSCHASFNKLINGRLQSFVCDKMFRYICLICFVTKYLFYSLLICYNFVFDI